MADFMLEKVTGALLVSTRRAQVLMCHCSECDQYLSLLTPSDVRSPWLIIYRVGMLIFSVKRRSLAGKLLGIGKELLRSSTQDDQAGNSARDSVKWIQRAFSTIEPLDDAADSGEGHLRVSLPASYRLTVPRTH